MFVLKVKTLSEQYFVNKEKRELDILSSASDIWEEDGVCQDERETEVHHRDLHGLGQPLPRENKGIATIRKIACYCIWQ